MQALAKLCNLQVVISSVTTVFITGMVISISNTKYKYEFTAWAPAEIFPEGAKPPTLSKVDTFSARRAKIDHF